ncbi:MAG: VOC family protein [Pseudomonadota bacterium]
MRALDHCVLPVRELADARTHLEALGFTLAADARHPFGTENACVFFEDGTYLEPLAIAQREDCEATAQKGNQFTLRDQTFRFRNGDEGFSAIAMATDDADSDHKAFVAAGISAGRKLRFSRKFKKPDGVSETARFKLAFAHDPRSPDSFAFCVERVAMPTTDISALTKHRNGVTGIVEVIGSEQNPTDFQYSLQEIFQNRETHAHSFGMSIEASNCGLDVLTPEGLKVRFGHERKSLERGIWYEGIVFGCRDVDSVKAMMDEAGVQSRTINRMLVTDRMGGSGAFFAFMEQEL